VSGAAAAEAETLAPAHPGGDTGVASQGPDLVLVAGMAAIALVALALRTIALGAHVPQLLGPDEPTVANRALAVLDGQLVPPAWDWPPLSSYLLAGVLALARPLAPGLTEVPARLYVFGRVVYALVSTGAVLGAGVLGAAAAPSHRRVAALGAASATAVSFLLVRSGRLVHPEQLQPLLMIGALMVVLRLDSAPRRRRAALIVGAGLLAGLAGATKYLGVAAAVPLAYALLTGPRGARGRELVLAGAATVGGFVAGTLGTVTAWEHFRSGVLDQFAHQTTGHLGYEPTGPGWAFHLAASLPGNWGWPATALAIAGLAWGIAGRQRRLRLVALTAAPVAVLVSVGQVRFPHYIVIAVPFLAVLGAAALAWLAAAARRLAGALGAAVLLAGAGASLLPTVAHDLRLVRATAGVSTRELATERLAALAPSVPVHAEAYGPTGAVTTTSFALGADPGILDCDCWVVLSSYQEQRYRQSPDRYGAEVAVYDRLRATGRVVTTVAPSQPLSYRWDLLPQWGLARIPLRGELGATGPTLTILDLTRPLDRAGGSTRNGTATSVPDDVASP